MSNNWKPIHRVREYGNQTDFIETSEFPDEPIKHFVDNEKECAEASRKALCEDEKENKNKNR